MGSLVARIKAAVAALRGAHFPTATSTLYDFFRLNAKSGVNWKEQVGNAQDNSIVTVCIGWIADEWPEAKPYLAETLKNGKEKANWDHPFLDLLKNPNPYYGSRVLWQALIIDLLVEGNAYLHIIKGAYDIPKALFWIPTAQVRPMRNDPGNDSAWIDYYEYNVGGKLYKIAPEDIVHLRQGINPNDPRLGWSRLRSGLAEVFTDNEAAATVNTLLGNRAVPGLIVSPKAVDLKQQGVTFEPMTMEQAQAIEAKANAKFTGDGKGLTWVHSRPVDVVQWGANIAELATRLIRQIPEERICAIFKIPPGVVKFGAGLERNTMSNASMEEEQAWRHGIVPLLGLVGDALKAQLLPQMELRHARFEVKYDLSQIGALQEDNDSKAKRLVSLWETDLLTHDEVRVELGYQADTARTGMYYSELMAPKADPQDEQDIEDGKALREQLREKWRARA